MQEIIRKLRAVRGKLRQYFLLHGIAACSLIVIGFLVGAFIIDYGLYLLHEDLPAGVRMAVLAIGGGLLGYGFIRFLLFPMSRNVSDDDIAARVETANPELNDRLISALQLSRVLENKDENDKNVVSRDLIQGAIDDAVEQSRKADFNKVLRFQPVARIWGRFALAAVVVFGLAFWQSDLAGTFIQRMVGMDAEWPKQTQLEFVNLPENNSVAKGDPLVLELNAVKGSPSKVWLRYKIDEPGARWNEELFIKRGSDNFIFEFERLTHNITFQAIGGDDKTPFYDIKAIPPPTIANIHQFIDYPDYTHLENTDPLAPLQGGEIKAPVGSMVTLVVHPSEALDSGAVFVQTQDDEEVYPLTAMPVDENRGIASMKAEIPIRFSTGYHIRLTAKNGLDNKEPYRYRIRAIDDKAPKIQVLDSTEHRHATPTATYPLHLDITDDYGVKEVRIAYQVESRPGEPVTYDVFTEAQLSGLYGARALTGEYLFNFEALNVQVKDRIVYWFEAEDYCDVNSETNITTTDKFYFTIVEPTELEDLVQDKINKLRDELKRILIRQTTKITPETVDLANDLEAATVVSRLIKSDLTSNAMKQRHITQRLESVERTMAEQLALVQYNNLFTDGQRDKLNSAQMLIIRSARETSPEAAFQIKETASGKTAERWMNSIGNAVRVQGVLKDDLTKALQYLEEYIDFQQIVKEVRRIKETQERLKERIRRQQSAGGDSANRDAMNLYKQAKALIDDGKNEEGRKLLEKILDSYPNSPAAKRMVKPLLKKIQD
jgi:hypothetical protein